MDYFREQSKLSRILHSTIPVLAILAIVGMFAFILINAYNIDMETKDFKQKCETQCAPFAYRKGYYNNGCECRNKENHWVSQEK